MMHHFSMPFVLLALALRGPMPEGSPVAHSGDTSLTATLARNRVVVTLTNVEISPAQLAKSGRNSPCDPEAQACSIVANILIKVGQHEILVPKRVYDDLGDLRSARLWERKGSMFLELIGGDGADTYVVRLQFNKELVKKRWFYSGMDLSVPLETTEYRTLIIE